MKHRAMRFIKISLARDALKLVPRLATGMSIGANIAAAEPTVIGAIRSRIEGRVRVDSALAASGKGEDRRWRAEDLGACIGALLTGFT
jgi:hypothetical protein